LLSKIQGREVESEEDSASEGEEEEVIYSKQQ
jgi:hypothetical protein